MSLPVEGVLVLGDLYGPFQTKPLYDSMFDGLFLPFF